MAQPALSTYSVTAGQPIHGGRWPGGRLSGNVDLAAALAAGAMEPNAADLGGGVVLGDAVAAGTVQGVVVPAWVQGAPIGQWIAISGTALNYAGGLNPNAFSDLTLRPSDSMLLTVASGGHLDGSSNAAAAIRLSDNAPAWSVLRDTSAPTVNVLYYADGRPTSRHTYHHTHYIAALDAVLLAGCRFGYGGDTPTGPGMDLFSLATNDYLPRYTWPDSVGGYGIVQDGSGNIWTAGGYKADATTGVMTRPGTGTLHRYPAAYDSVRDKIFALQWGDGEGFGAAQLNAAQLDPATGNSVAITFNASAALTAFQSAAPTYAGMAFCPVDGRFYFMAPASPQTLYVVTPNAGTVWDMTTLAVGGATLPAVHSGSGSLCKRFLWVPMLNGFVVQTNQTSNLHFLRMA